MTSTYRFAATLLITATMVLGWQTCQEAYADPSQDLLIVTADNKKSRGLVFRFELFTDGGKIDRIDYHTFDEHTNKPTIETYNLSQLNNASGLEIVTRDGYKVVKMFGQNVHPDRGGLIRTDYLVNGLTNKRRDFWMRIWKKPSGEWQLGTVEGREINELFFKTNRILLKEVGVAAIEIRR